MVYFAFNLFYSVLESQFLLLKQKNKKKKNEFALKSANRKCLLKLSKHIIQPDDHVHKGLEITSITYALIYFINILTKNVM